MGDRTRFSVASFLFYFYCAEMHVTTCTVWIMSACTVLALSTVTLSFLSLSPPSARRTLLLSDYRTITAFHCCVAFCCTTTWSAMCMHITLALGPPSHPAVQPSRSSRSPQLSSVCCTAAPQLSVAHPVSSKRQCSSPSASRPLLTPLCPQVHSPPEVLFLPCI